MGRIVAGADIRPSEDGTGSVEYTRGALLDGWRVGARRGPPLRCLRRVRYWGSMLRLSVRNLRALREVEITLEDLLCIVGANGAGKTTLLFALQFLQTYVRRGLDEAMNVLGYRNVRHRDASPSEPISLELSSGEAKWRLELDVRGVDARVIRDELSFGAEPVAWAKVSGALQAMRTFGLASFSSTQLAPLTAPVDLPAEVVELVRAVMESGTHFDPDLRALRENGSKASRNTALEPRSENAFAMLRRWHERKPDRPRFDFVRDTLRAALPDLVEDLDFDVGGDSVFLRVWRPRAESPDVITYESNGLLSLVVTLTAIASGVEGSVVAVDEPENGLHPFALARLAERARQWAVSHRVAVVFTTHSPVLLNQLRREPGRVVVFEDGRLATLDTLRDRAWLEGLLPGELYENLEIGAPPVVTRRS